MVTPRIWVSPRSNSAEPCTRGHDLDLGRQRPDVGEAAAVDADLVAQDPLADDLLGQRAEGAGDLLLAALELAGQRGLDLVLERVGGVLALLLAGDLHAPAASLSPTCGLDGGVDVVLVVQEDAGTRATGLAAFVGQLGLRVAQRLDERLGGLEALRPRPPRSGAVAPPAISSMVFSVASASTIMIATSPSGRTRPATTMSKTASSSSVVGREADPLAVDQRDAGAADRAGERQAGELGGRRGAR